jgi:hypothetical protein
MDRTREREQLEAERFRLRKSSAWLDDAIKSDYFNRACDCGHMRSAHRGLSGTGECFECSCIEFERTSDAMETCLCGHVRVEHNNRGECWRPDCLCGLYRPENQPVDKIDDFLERVQSEDKQRMASVVPVRDDVTSFPVLGYVMRDNEGWFVAIQRIACDKDSRTWTPAIEWPRRYAWFIRCVQGPPEAKNRSLNSECVWEMGDRVFSVDRIGMCSFETPEQAYAVWQRYEQREMKSTREYWK